MATLLSICDADTDPVDATPVYDPTPYNRQTGAFPTPDLPADNQPTNAGMTDEGRKMVTGKTADRGKFKVPSLRNIEFKAVLFGNG